jgi:hypothetical protein
MYYPAFPEKEVWALKVMKQSLEEDPDYFNHPDCPYGDDLKAVFDVVRVTQTSSVGNVDELEAEVTVLFEELKEFGGDLEKTDVSERMAWFRTRTSLLEKILDIKKEAAGVKQVQEFQNRVLGILEDVMTPDQRTEIMQRLKEG